MLPDSGALLVDSVDLCPTQALGNLAGVSPLFWHFLECVVGAFVCRGFFFHKCCTKKTRPFVIAIRLSILNDPMPHVVMVQPGPEFVAST